MGQFKITNFADTLIASGINASDTTISLTTGTGALFPTLAAGDWFYAVLVDVNSNREIVKATARTTDTVTVERAQEGTTARSFVVGSVFSARLTAQGFQDYVSSIALTAAGAVLMQNKSLEDSTTFVVDNADTTKKAQFQASNITTATTRVVSLQDKDLTMAGTDVAQTFTAQQTPMKGTLTDASTIDWDGNTHGQSVKLTTAAPRTMNAPTNIIEDNLYVLRLTTNGHTPAWNAAFKWATAPTALENATYVFTFIGGASNTLLPTGTGYKTGA